MDVGTLVAYYGAALPALFVTALVIAACVDQVRKARRLREDGLVADADVLAAEVLDGNLQYPLKRSVSVAFRTGADRVITTKVLFLAAWRVVERGDVIPVRYDPRDPEVAMLDRGENHGRHEIRNGTVGIVLAAIIAVPTAAILLLETGRYILSR